jgi:hypothetical protein
MTQRSKSDLPVYHKNTLEFVAVAKSYCDFMDQLDGIEKALFIDTSTKLLPLLYLKASLLPVAEPMLEEAPETFATEDQYQALMQTISELLGNDDVYLDVFHPDIRFSDTPVANFVSENMADIWQDLFNFISIFRIGYEETMNESLHQCKTNFETYWGQSLVNVLRALHRCKFPSIESNPFGAEIEEEDFE